MTDAQIIHAIRLAMWRGLISEEDLLRSLARLSYPAVVAIKQQQSRRTKKAA